MEYYKLLQLDREPFSNSPDPDYFFQSGEHLVCLQKLELALRLKRGLNVVIGDVGTGKTTLCRQMLRTFASDPDFEAHLILDPSFSTAHAFTRHIYELFCEPRQPVTDPSDSEMKEWIKQCLFAKGVDQGKTIALIIDEGQKIGAACIEILRELLNYETNTFKLLQIVIFAQLEFEDVLSAYANFTDRINMLHYLRPMNFKDTCQMVRHRLKLASTTARPRKLFTLPAMWAVYRASKGYPRKIIHLCHQSMLALIIQNRTQAGWALIRSCRKRIAPSVRPARSPLLFISLAIVGLLIIIGYAPKFMPRGTENIASYAIKIPPSETIPPASPQQAANADSQPEVQRLPEAERSVPTPPQNELQAASGLQMTVPVPERASTVNAMAAVSAVPPSKKHHVQPPAAPLAAPAAMPPGILGQLVVRPGDTMIALVKAVYGIDRTRYLKAVMDANAQVPNPNEINIGQTIAFPALRSKSIPVNCQCWWVILDQEPSLQAARRRFLELQSRAELPLQLLPTWSPQSGARFQIVLRGYFSSESEALEVTRTLPQELAVKSSIISNWPPETIFYSNPVVPAEVGIQPHHTTSEALN